MKFKIKIFSFFLFGSLILLACRKDPSPALTTESLLAKKDSIARADSIAQTYELEGYLIDSVTLKPIAHTSIYLVYRSSLNRTYVDYFNLDTVKSDSKGYFKFLNRYKNNKPEYLGYRVGYSNQDYNEGSYKTITSNKMNFGNVYLKPYRTLTLNLNKIGLFNLGDTLFVNTDYDKYYYLNNEANGTFKYMVKGYSGSINTTLSWCFKTSSSNNCHKDTIHFEMWDYLTYTINY